jgi:hypothetical protein
VIPPTNLIIEVPEKLANEIVGKLIMWQQNISFTYTIEEHEIILDVLPDSLRPRFETAWGLLGYLFFRRTRERVWTPVVEEMKADYLLAMKQHRTKCKRCWIKICFALQTILLLLQTLRLCVVGMLWLIIPLWLRQELGQILQHLFP